MADETKNACLCRKIKKWEPYSREWEHAANVIARSWCPPIKPCRTCSGPVVDGYVCRDCGEDNP